MLNSGKVLSQLSEDMRHLKPAPPDAPIRQAKANSDKHAQRISDPVA